VVPVADLVFRVAVFMMTWWLISYYLDPDKSELSSLQTRIKYYRQAAEFFGRKVISCEAEYYKLAEQGRMN
jgi:hypothetical protein